MSAKRSRSSASVTSPARRRSSISRMRADCSRLSRRRRCSSYAAKTEPSAPSASMQRTPTSRSGWATTRWSASCPPHEWPIAEGRMQPAGLRAFEARTDDRSAIYAYEQRHGAKLAPEDERQFRSEERAWSFFQAQPPSYRKTAIWWVASAKRDETRRRRLRTLIEDSAKGVRVRQLRRREAGG